MKTTYAHILTRTILLICVVLIGVSAGLFAQDVDSLGYEQAMKQHLVSLNRTANSLAKFSPTANQNGFDVTYYKIAVAIAPIQSSIKGSVSVYGESHQSLSTIELNLEHHLIVDSVFFGGAKTTYTHENDLLTINIAPLIGAQQFAVVVHYHGVPVYDGFGSFTFGYHNQLPVIATLSEPFYARNWWPCKDHPSDKADSVDMFVTRDGRITAVSNGTLISTTTNLDGTHTTHWHESYPIATYLVSLAIADYEHYADTFHYAGGSMPVDFYILSGNVETYRDANSQVVEMLDFFSKIYGEYPFIHERYGEAQTFFGGGMEHQTCASIGVFQPLLLAHELAHQWWGDMITCGTWHDIWLNEGFARYSEALWLEHQLGPSGLRNYMNGLIHLDQQVFVADTSDAHTIFDRVVYDKGAFVLHMLRHAVGDTTFFAILRAYADSKHRYGSATTDDFQAVCEQVAKRSFETFFNQWVYQPALPVYEYGLFAYESDSGWVTDVKLDQVQQNAPTFETEVDLQIRSIADTLIYRLNNDRRTQTYRLLLHKAPIEFQLDPDNWLIERSSQVALSLQPGVDTLPAAAKNLPYSYQLSAIAGIPPFQWTVDDATLPEGFSLSADGLLSGTTSATGEFTIAIGLSDSSVPARTDTTHLILLVSKARGDVDKNPGLAFGDLVFFVRYLYLGGPGPADLVAADANCDGSVDILDIVTLVNYLYNQGPLPCFES